MASVCAAVGLGLGGLLPVQKVVKTMENGQMENAQTQMKILQSMEKVMIGHLCDHCSMVFCPMFLFTLSFFSVRF